MSEAVALPRWQSHKKVWAAKIVERRVARDTEDWVLDNGGIIERVKSDLIMRVPKDQQPVGGYYVRYEDGFESWSPAKAFEEGYTRI